MMEVDMLIWRGIAPIRVDDGVQVEGPDVEREAIQALQAVAEAAYKLWGWVDEAGFGGSAVDNVRYRLEAAGFDTARGAWRAEVPGHD